MIGLIGGTFDDMMRRYEEMAAGQPADYPRTLLVIDEYTVFTMLVSAWWAQERRRQGGQLPEQHPVIRQARGLVILGRAARMNAAIATLRPAGLPVDIVNNLRHLAGAWPAAAQAALVMFGDVSAGRGIPVGARGEGTALSAAGRARVKVHWLPVPAHWNDPARPLAGEERRLLLGMLPQDAVPEEA